MKVFQAGRSGRHRRPQPKQTWLFIAVVAVGVAVAWPHVAGVPLPQHVPHRVPWLLLAVGYAAARAATVRFEFSGETHSATLSEVALLVGLVFVRSDQLLLAAVLGTAGVSLCKRERPVKAVFNLTVKAAETLVAVVSFHLVLGGHRPLSGWGWLAGLVAVAAASALSALCVQAVIRLSVGRTDRAEVGRMALVLAAVVLANLALGEVVVAALWASPKAAWVTVALAAAFAFGYHKYIALHRDREDLRHLYQLSKTLSGLVDEPALKEVLREARYVLRSEIAELALDGPDGEDRYLLGEDDELDTWSEPTMHPLRYAAAKSGGLLAPRGTNDREAADALAACGYRDAVAAPVIVDDRCIGVLVGADRRNDRVTFRASDVTLVGVLANHTAMALHSSQLLAQLHTEVAAKDHQALHDGLTGLANRSLFNDRVEEMLKARSGESVVAVMVMDLDRFKEVNDTLGHHTGDVVLQQIGAQLAEAVAGRGVVARLGGDEFAFVCGAETRAAVAAVAGDVLAAGQATMVVEGLRLEVRASLGVAMAPDHGGDRSTLLRRADIAMYHAKTVGSGIEVYQSQRDPHTTRRLVLASELRLALETSALELHYQPKAEIVTGRVSGVEALLRWTHPVYGTVGPDEFIPLAEQSGLMRPLTMWALESSVAQLATWRREGLDLTLAVNLSARSVFDAQLADDLDRLLARWGVPAGALTLEITESSLFGDRPKGHTALDHLADLGVRLAIDDFGTGYSSLSRPARLPVQEVKIDKSFVTTMLTNEGHDAIVRSTIDLARNLRLRAVAEGVEDEATWRRLGRLGCDAGQGYYLSPPLRAAELASWLWQYQRPARAIRALRPVSG